MAQSTILALGQTRTTSTDVIIAAGATVTVGMYTDTVLPREAKSIIYISTPSKQNILGILDLATPQRAVVGPATIRIERQECGLQNIGIWLDA
jgi:hypothetical protein